MKICIEYNGRWVEMDKPDHNYGSNIETFREIAHLAFAAVELELEGEINEVDPNRPQTGYFEKKRTAVGERIIFTPVLSR